MYTKLNAICAIIHSLVLFASPFVWIFVGSPYCSLVQFAFTKLLNGTIESCQIAITFV